MISHKHECIFIHIPKTGGMSIEKAFMDSLKLNLCKGECPPLLLSYNRNNKIGPLSLAHLSPQEYLDYGYVNSKIYEKYFKFSFVRDPYDRLFSIYRHFNYQRIISFNDFIQIEFPKLYQSKYYFVKPQVEYLYHKNRLVVDFIGRFENFYEDFRKMEQRISLDVGELEHINQSNKKYNIYSRWNLVHLLRIIRKKPYLISHLDVRKKDQYSFQDFFNQTSLDLVNNLYRKDFDLLNYPMIEKV